MNLCRNCVYWHSTRQWKGNCKKHPWPKDRYSEDAHVINCPDYTSKSNLAETDFVPISSIIKAVLKEDDHDKQE
jgi:hypothetical protein